MVQRPEVDLEASDQAGMGSCKKVPAYSMVREEVEEVRMGSYMMVLVHSTVDLGMGMDMGTEKVLLKDKISTILNLLFIIDPLLTHSPPKTPKVTV